MDTFREGCQQLGVLLAECGFDLVVASEAEITADPWVTRGFVEGPGGGRRTVFVVQYNGQYGYQSAASCPWLDWRRIAAEDSAFSAVGLADVVILLGGGAGTKGAYHLSVAQGKPVIPIGSFGGEAEYSLRTAPGVDADERDALARDWGPAVLEAVRRRLQVQVETFRHVRQRADLAIITALHDSELRYLFYATGSGPKQNENLWHSFHVSADPTRYYSNIYKSKRGATIEVVAASQNTMGMAAAAALAAKMILTFKPRLVAMVGIAAGVSSGQQNFGDILAADRTFDYSAGKIIKVVPNSRGKGTKNGKRNGGGQTAVRFKPDTPTREIKSRITGILKEWQATPKLELSAIRQAYLADPHPGQALRLHVGPIATGPWVVENPGIIEDARTRIRKTIGLEMESYGVHTACAETTDPATPFLCVKSICDFATPERAPENFPFAAFTAAKFCEVFVSTEWESLMGA